MMKWMPSAIAAILAAAAANALEIPAEVRLLYADERRQNPGIYEVVPKFEFPERNGLVRVDVLVSRKTEDGRWVFRNRLDRIFLKDGKIDAVRRPGAPGDFWSAALAAEKFLYADSGEQGKKLSFSELDGTPCAPPAGNGCQADMRTPGRYLFPVPGGRPLSGISPETVEKFRRLPAREEAAWLRERLRTLPPPAEAVSLLKRLDAVGEFSYPLTAGEREGWRKLLLEERLGVMPRRLLQQQLFQANFLPHEEFAAELLADPLLGSRTAEAFAERNRPAFETLILRWSSQPDKQETALRYSEYMADNADYRNRMLSAFREPAPEQLSHLIPLYAGKPAADGSPELKKLLRETPYSGNFRLLCRVAEWCLKTRPAAYAPEIKAFLRRERNNPDLKRSVLYPLLLASLCKANDLEGAAEAIAYLKSLKDPAQIENAKCIWGKGMTGPVTLDRIIRELQKKRSLL